MEQKIRFTRKIKWVWANISFTFRVNFVEWTNKAFKQFIKLIFNAATNLRKKVRLKCDCSLLDTIERDRNTVRPIGSRLIRNPEKSDHIDWI